jgi:hypothetical protein
MAGFSGLGLGFLGNEQKYFGEPGPGEMPGFLQGIIDVPKAYAAQKFITPAVNYLQNKFTLAVPPPTTPVGVSPAMLAPSQASTTVALPADADHPELQGILAVDPYAQIKP